MNLNSCMTLTRSNRYIFILKAGDARKAHNHREVCRYLSPGERLTLQGFPLQSLRSFTSDAQVVSATGRACTCLPALRRASCAIGLGPGNDPYALFMPLCGSADLGPLNWPRALGDPAESVRAAERVGQRLRLDPKPGPKRKRAEAASKRPKLTLDHYFRNAA
eukprot:5942541-Pyramimonas_sp.AAC.1